MEWKKVRELYPNQFIKFEIIESYVKNSVEYIYKVKVIKAIKNGKDAMKELISCNYKELVYSTTKEDIKLEIVKNVSCYKEDVECKD